MDLFLFLFSRLIPLYVTILLGYIAGRYLTIQNKTVSSLLIYILTPFVMFHGSSRVEVAANTLILPFMFLAICCGLCLLFYAIGKKIWTGSEKNILAFTAGTGNTGYFAIPVAIALFGEEALGIAVLSTLGFVLYMNTLGFFITAKGNHTTRESIMRVLKLPSIYAFVLGVVVNILDIQLGDLYENLYTQVQGTYSVLGMMLVGMGISTIKSFDIDWKFTGIAFFAKFIVWPLLIGAIIVADSLTVSFFTPDIYNIMVLMAIVPLASNSVAFATELNVHPKKISVAVFLSTMVALVFIPVVLMVVRM